MRGTRPGRMLSTETLEVPHVTAQGAEGLRSRQGQAFRRQTAGATSSPGRGRREGELAPDPGAGITSGGWVPTPTRGPGCPQLGGGGRLNGGERERRNLCLYFAPH